MGKLKGDEGGRATLSLVGNFRLSAPDGSEIRITEKKGRVLLAMLATARDRRRSREWLKARLWSRSFEPQASNSLRQSLHSLRKALQPYEDILQANYEHVWLEDVDTDVDPGSDARAEFFEDAPVLDEACEDWLREERQAFSARIEDAPRAMVDVGDAVPVVPVVFESRPCILIGSPIVVSEDERAAAVAERITNAMESTFRQNGYVETYDLRDLESNQLEGRMIDSVSRPPVLVEVRVSLIGRELQATIVARVPATGKIVWTSSIGSDVEADFMLTSELMTEFVMGAVDSIEALIMRQQGGGVRPTLYTAVHQLFSLSREGIIDASGILRQFTEDEYSANAEAWLGFGMTLLIGERHDPKEDAIRQAHAHIDHAIDMDPSNALVLAIAGHFAGFVNRDLALGKSYLADSRRFLPNLAFGWDATAMNHLYSGDIANGSAAADIARRLGRYSPYRFYYDTSAVIAATLDERHDDAISLGNRVLAKRPDFLPVMRHMFASHALKGNTSEALRMFARLQELDPVFGTKGMGSDSYVLPSAVSLKIINRGLEAAGLIEKSVK